MADHKLTYIPSGRPFAQDLARGLIRRIADHALQDALILLPTRRACRQLREAFLRETGGKPAILPQMTPIGDVDEEELTLRLSAADPENLPDIPPAIAPVRRKLLLARTIRKIPGWTNSPAAALDLAAALARLIDQVHTEGLNPEDLTDLIEEEEQDLARHWQITLEYLRILWESWPAVLAERGVIDPADRRNRIIRALSTLWTKAPPQTPVIAAGTTGSIPATAELLGVIAALPQGQIVLPGIDTTLDDESWDALDPSHPQATLRALLKKLNGTRQDVTLWTAGPETRETRRSAARRDLIREVMRPAETIHKWQTLKADPDTDAMMRLALENLTLYQCETAHEEAQTIALILRETLERPGKTAAVITPDRKLARRIETACRRWGIETDDSGGTTLPHTRTGTFLKAVILASNTNLAPIPLLSLLKHTRADGGGQAANESWRQDIRLLDYELLRGPKPPPGIEGLRRRLSDRQHDPRMIRPLRDPEKIETLTRVIDKLAESFAPLDALKAGQSAKFTDWLTAHIRVAEAISAPEILWQGEDGDAAAAWLADLLEQPDLPHDLHAEDYAAVFDHLTRDLSIRPGFGTHPRLSILGQLEARAVQADVTILAGLNEGTWPPDPGADPWMSRPMRAAFGLPPMEQGIGLAAHDFQMGVCAPDVIMTRARRIDGTPTIPSRWLERLRAVLYATGHTLAAGPESPATHLSLARALDHVPPDETCPLPRPAPELPAAACPKRLSVTRVQSWMADPYQVFAREILRLYPLDPPEKDADQMTWGNAVHECLELFLKDYDPQDPAAVALDRLIETGIPILRRIYPEPQDFAFNLPRFKALAENVIAEQKDWENAGWIPGDVEKKGEAELTFDDLGLGLTLTARADRIDREKTNANARAVIDYKTGGPPSATKVRTGQAPQLPLTGLIINNGGFPDIPNGQTTCLRYWQTKGNLSEKERKKQADQFGEETQALIAAAQDGIHDLLAHFGQDGQIWPCQPNGIKAQNYNDYAHFERIAEWSAAEGDGDGETGAEGGNI